MGLTRQRVGIYSNNSNASCRALYCVNEARRIPVGECSRRLRVHDRVLVDELQHLRDREGDHGECVRA